MDKAFLYQLADKAKNRADEHKAALATYHDELKKSGRVATKEDADAMKNIEEKLVERLNVHAEIYRQIYAAE